MISFNLSSSRISNLNSQLVFGEESKKVKTRALKDKLTDMQEMRLIDARKAMQLLAVTVDQLGNPKKLPVYDTAGEKRKQFTIFEAIANLASTNSGCFGYNEDGQKVTVLDISDLKPLVGRSGLPGAKKTLFSKVRDNQLSSALKMLLEIKPAFRSNLADFIALLERIAINPKSYFTQFTQNTITAVKKRKFGDGQSGGIRTIPHRRTQAYAGKRAGCGNEG